MSNVDYVFFLFAAYSMENTTKANIKNVTCTSSYLICDMIWTMEAKVGNCEIEIQEKLRVKNKEIDNTNMHNFVTE